MTAGFPRTASELPLARELRVGDLVVHLLETGLVWLDGGAMFGVVPKPLWEKRIPADDRNRIPLAMRSALVRTPDELVLIETGLGDKEDEKFRAIYGVDNAAPGGDGAGRQRLEAALASAGVRPEEVTVVVNTHLHFDHAGGNTLRDGDGGIRLAFPEARYFVQRGEWEYAHLANERTRASYLPDNYDPVEAAGRFHFLDGEEEVVPGISVIRTPGHTPHHQSVVIRSGGETACYLGDVAPTSAHLPLAWIMGYDVEPLVTLESKRELLGRAAGERWRLIFTHDPVVPSAQLVETDRGISIAEPEETR